MSISDMFKGFLNNLAIDNADSISSRYGEITRALNLKFRNTDSRTQNSLQVGSFGRKTGIRGISDLDMLYVMPKSEWETYKDGRQLKLLQDTKQAIVDRYPKTKIRVDRLVVTVTYSNFHIEVQPVFRQDDGSFKYPDTKDDGSWKITKPREEMSEMSDMDLNKNCNLKRLCKMARAWKNKHGVGMGGLLVDTLAYNFLKSTEEYDTRSYSSYDWMSRDFFKYLSELPEQEYYDAPGSAQRVKVKKKFQRKAKKAYNLCLDAIEADGKSGVNDKWKKVYGRCFPDSDQVEVVKSSNAAGGYAWDNTEQFIEDRYPVDVRHSIGIDCDVKQNGFRENSLRQMIGKKIPLLAQKRLYFRVTSCNVPEPFDLHWKVLNRGEEARKRNKIRGQIVPDAGRMQKEEPTQFKGDHVVECYAVKDGVVVAKDRIHVPISNNSRS